MTTRSHTKLLKEKILNQSIKLSEGNRLLKNSMKFGNQHQNINGMYIECSDESRDPHQLDNNNNPWLTPQTWKILNEKCRKRDGILGFRFFIKCTPLTLCENRVYIAKFIITNGKAFYTKGIPEDTSISFTNNFWYLESALKQLLEILKIQPNNHEQIKQYLNNMIIEKADENYNNSIHTIAMAIHVNIPEPNLKYDEIIFNNFTVQQVTDYIKVIRNGNTQQPNTQQPNM